MCRHGENIYRRKDGRYEDRYIVGKTDEGKTRFGYVYGYQYMEVRRKLAEHKTALLTQSLTDAPARCRIASGRRNALFCQEGRNCIVLIKNASKKKIKKMKYKKYI